MSDKSVTCHGTSRGYPDGEQRDVTVTPPLRASRVTLSPDPATAATIPPPGSGSRSTGIEGHDGRAPLVKLRGLRLQDQGAVCPLRPALGMIIACT